MGVDFGSFAFGDLVFDWVVGISDGVILAGLIIKVIKFVIETAPILNGGNFMLVYWGQISLNLGLGRLVFCRGVLVYVGPFALPVVHDVHF